MKIGLGWQFGAYVDEAFLTALAVFSAVVVIYTNRRWVSNSHHQENEIRTKLDD
jgi:hypothetical protein